MLLSRYSKWRFRGKIGNVFLFREGGRGGGGGGGAWLRTPLRVLARDTGPSLVFHIIGVEGFYSSVHPPPPPPLSEISGSAPEINATVGR